MGRVVVVGGGLGGCACAVRLAKLGHDVLLLEQGTRVGGAVGHVDRPGFRWDAGPSTTLLPAVLRDLFRKSGRPLERELDLVLQDPPRRHRTSDGTWLELPGGSRSVQHAALTSSLGEPAADVWLEWTRSQAEPWERLRDAWFEHVWDPAHVDRGTRELLESRRMLQRAVRSALPDPRLRELALWQTRLEGHEARDVPAWFGILDYLEQQLGVWTVPRAADGSGGFGGFADLLAKRLAERRVDVRLGVTVRDVEVSGGRAVGVRLSDDVVPADHVVVAVDPRSLPALAHHVRRTSPAIPPLVTHLGLEGDVPPLPPETVLHGDPLVVVRTGGVAPEGAHAWTLVSRGAASVDDVLRRLADVRIDVRTQVVERVDRTSLDLAREVRGSSYGVLWQGRATLRHRMGTTTPVPGVLAAGAHAGPGAGVPFVGLGAALVAQEIGPA